MAKPIGLFRVARAMVSFAALNPSCRPRGTKSRNPIVAFGISFSPLIPIEFVWAAAAVAAVVTALLVLARSRGVLIRAGALALMVLALANPSLTREDRDPLTSVAVVVVDKSPSQNFGDRTAQTEAARAAVIQRLQRIPGIETRVIEAGQADGETDGTVHDLPSDTGALGFAAPVHALITGTTNEKDRRVVLVAAPRFGIVGQNQTISFRVEDEGVRAGGAADVKISRDGELVERHTVIPG